MASFTLKFLVGLSEQWLIDGKLSSIHFWVAGFLECHLFKKELGIIGVNLIDSFFESFLFDIVVLLVNVPHLSLLIYVFFITLFSGLLLLALLCKERSHLLLLISKSLCSPFFKLPLSHLTLILVSHEHCVL